MNKFDRMYAAKFFKEGSNRKGQGEFLYPNFTDIFVLDFFYLSDSFLKCNMTTQEDYYEKCDEILKTVKIYP